jgi:hypothetical protein
MLHLIRSWKESLSIFLPKNFKLFLLVTLKSSAELCGNLFYFFWWLLLATFVFLIGGYYPAWILTGVIWLIAGNLLIAALVFVLGMLARPSVLPKDYPYFKQHIKKTAVGFLGIYILFDIVRAFLLNVSVYMILQSLLTGATGLFLKPLYIYVNFRLSFVPFMVFPPFLFVALFYADSDGSVKSWLMSFLRGLAMYIYNLPFCFVSNILFFIVWFCFAQLSFEFSLYLLWLFVPVMLCYFKNMYVKRLYDQFNLYFAKE